ISHGIKTKILGSIERRQGVGLYRHAIDYDQWIIAGIERRVSSDTNSHFCAGCSELDVICTPGARPCKMDIGSWRVVFSISSLPTDTTDPVRFVFFCVPYATTTKSSMTTDWSRNTIFNSCLSPTVTLTASLPMKEKVSLSWGLARIENFPSSSVITPSLILLIRMVTPAM